MAIRFAAASSIALTFGSEVNPNVDEIIEKTVLSRIAGFWAPQNRIEGYRAVAFPFEKLDTPPFQLRIDWDLEHLFSYLHSWSATRLYMESKGNQFLLDAYDAILSVWGDPKQRRTVIMPLHLLAGLHR